MRLQFTAVPRKVAINVKGRRCRYLHSDWPSDSRCRTKGVLLRRLQQLSETSVVSLQSVGNCYLFTSLLDEVRTVLDVRQQICVWVIQNTDGLIEEQVRKGILHPEGHVQDVRHLGKRRRRRRLNLDNPRVKVT